MSTTTPEPSTLAELQGLSTEEVRTVESYHMLTRKEVYDPPGVSS